MRLLADLHCFDYETSEGVNTYLQGLYRELIKSTTDIDFFFIARDINKIKRIFGESNHVHYIALRSDNKIYRLLVEIPSIIKKHKIDFAHFQYVSPLIKNCKTIVTLHDILFLDFPQFFPAKYKLAKGGLFKFSAKRADILLTVSDYSKRQISKHYHIPEQNIVVTPNAVSDDFFRIEEGRAKRFLASRELEKYILYVSRIEPRKNQIALLKAYCELELWREPYNLDLVLIGRKTLSTPECDEYYDSLASGIKSRIHFINQVPYDELLLFYKGASLFVYPALAEGFGIPPIEAAAAGVPCVCSNKTAMSDFTFFDSNLIDVSDKSLLKNTILENLSNNNREKLIQTSELIKEKYNWRKAAKSYQEALLKNYTPLQS